MKIFIKYCGGCNTNINRKELVSEIVNRLKEHTSLEIANQGADVGLVVGGCQVCCVNIDDIRDCAQEFVIVGGELVDCIKVPPEEQGKIIAQKMLASKNTKLQ